MSPETRARVSAAGGAARVAGLDAAGRSRLAAAGAAAVNSPLGRARSIARAWDGLDEATRGQLRDVLLPLLVEDGGLERVELGDAVGDDQGGAERVEQVPVKRARAGRKPVGQAAADPGRV